MFSKDTTTGIVYLIIAAALIAIAWFHPEFTQPSKSAASTSVKPIDLAQQPDFGDTVSCIGGIAHHHGSVLILHGNTIKC